MKLAKKVEIYNALLAGLSKGVRLAADLRDASKDDEADQVERKNNTLASESARLRRNIRSAWNGQAATVLGEIRSSNQKLQRQIRSIRDQIDSAERFMKALGTLDELIAIAAKVL